MNEAYKNSMTVFFQTKQVLMSFATYQQISIVYKRL